MTLVAAFDVIHPAPSFYILYQNKLYSIHAWREFNLRIWIMNIILWSAPGHNQERNWYNEERWFRKVFNVIFANLDRDTNYLFKHPYLNFFRIWDFLSRTFIDILSTIWYLGLLSWEMAPFSCTGGPFLGSLVCLAGVAGLHAVHGLVHTVAVTLQLIPGHELRRGCPPHPARPHENIESSWAISNISESSKERAKLEDNICISTLSKSEPGTRPLEAGGGRIREPWSLLAVY